MLWRAEAAQAAAVAAFVQGRRADALAAGRSVASAEDARQVAILEVGVELEQASGFVAHLVASTVTSQGDLPTVWAAHSAGDLDRAKARAIAAARWRLHEPASVEALDETVVAYGTTHTLAQLKAWLRRFVLRVERAHGERRRREAHALRHVTITAMDDGMSLLQAVIPTPAALLIERELSLAAKTARAADPDDDRRLSQAGADVLTDRLLGHDHATARGRFHVGITVPLTSLLDLDDDPAVTCDRPAEACDLDHQEPWDPGPTTGPHLHHRCRSHHRLKTRSALTVTHTDDTTTEWQLPTRTTTGRTAFIRAWTRRHEPQVIVIEQDRTPIHAEYVPT